MVIGAALRLPSIAVTIVGALLCFFGVIHSVRADGSAYALWQLEGTARDIAIQFCAAYVILAAAFLLLSLMHQGDTPTLDQRR